MRTDVPLTPVPFERRVDSPLWGIMVRRTKHEIALRDGHKVCTGCHVDKPLEEYHEQHNGTGGRTSKCKTCRSVRTERSAA